MIEFESFEKPELRATRYGVRLRNSGSNDLRRVSGVFDLPPGLVAPSSLRLRIAQLAAGAHHVHEIRVLGSTPGDYTARLKLNALTAAGELLEMNTEVAITVRADPERDPARASTETRAADVGIVDLSPEKWGDEYEHVQVTVRNDGEIHARRVVVLLRGEIEGDRRAVVSGVGPGETAVAEFNVRPRGSGKVRVVAKCLYWHGDRQESSACTRVFWRLVENSAKAAPSSVVIHGDVRSSTRVEVRDSVVSGSSVAAGAEETNPLATDGTCGQCGRTRLASWGICPYCGQ